MPRNSSQTRRKKRKAAQQRGEANAVSVSVAHVLTCCACLCRYVTKDSVEFNALLSLVVQARRDIDLYTSRAADAGTDERRAKHLMTRIWNKIDAELSDTFAAMIVLGFPADDSSEIFVSWDPWIRRNSMCTSYST